MDFKVPPKRRRIPINKTEGCKAMVYTPWKNHLWVINNHYKFCQKIMKCLYTYKYWTILRSTSRYTTSNLRCFPFHGFGRSSPGTNLASEAPRSRAPWATSPWSQPAGQATNGAGVAWMIQRGKCEVISWYLTTSNQFLLRLGVMTWEAGISCIGHLKLAQADAGRCRQDGKIYRLCICFQEWMLIGYAHNCWDVPPQMPCLHFHHCFWVKPFALRSGAILPYSEVEPVGWLPITIIKNGCCTGFPSI